MVSEKLGEKKKKGMEFDGQNSGKKIIEQFNEVIFIKGFICSKVQVFYYMYKV